MMRIATSKGELIIWFLICLAAFVVLALAYYLKLHPRLAPIKAAVFPLIKKEGMPEKAAEIYRDLKQAGIACYYDQQGAIGRRYRRQDEIGTPYCLTVDGDTATDNCVTLRDRDTLAQERIPIAELVGTIGQRLRA